MKTNNNSKMAQLARIVALTATLALPSVALAAPANAGRVLNHVDRAAVTQPAATLREYPFTAVQFNLVDGQPIR